MPAIPILIPLGDGHSISQFTLTSLVNQSEQVEIITVSRPINYIDKRMSEGLVRFILAEIAQRLAEQKYLFFIMMDRSVIIPNPTTLAQLKAKISNGQPRFIHVPYKQRYVPEDHMDIEMFAWPSSLCSVVVKAFSETRYQPGVCWCNALQTLALESGIAQEWL